MKTMKKWYHEWQQNARNRYLAGYYPGHERMPNFVVRGLYGIGYFFGDFVPLILNFINAVYATIKRLIAFIVGLLVESSIFIVLIGSIVFSVSHSIERLRQAGATDGLEYVGVLMFEVIFISSAATLTGIFMKKKLPSGFLEWTGAILTFLGFLVGLGFVWWSNVNGMAPTWEGFIIGSLVPVLVLIGEGILAYRFLREFEEDNQTRLMEIIQRNGLTVGEAMKAIEMYLDVLKKMDGKAIENSDKNGNETNREMVEKAVEKVVEDGTIFAIKNGNETVENDTGSNTISEERNGTENERATVKETVEERLEKLPESSHQTVNEEVEKHSQQEEPEPEISMDSANENLPVTNEKEAILGDGSSKEAVERMDENETENDTGNDEKAVEEMVENDTGSDTENDEKVVEEMDENETENDTGKDEKAVEETVENQTEKKTSKRKKLVKGSAELKSQLRRSVKKFAKKYFKENGKPPGRVVIQKEFGVSQSLARDLADYVKNELRVS